MSDQKMATRIAALLAKAESAAALGNEAERDAYLEKASALQLKYAIDDTMARQAGQQGTDEVTYRDFLDGESNTPLIKAKRQLINVVALFMHGKAVITPKPKVDAEGWQVYKNGRPVWNRRAFIRVYAHTSDLDFISALYASLLIQLHTMMAADERRTADDQENLGTAPWSAPKAWRVSYAHGWVLRIDHRLQEIKRGQMATQGTSEPGTALVLRDRTQLVTDYVTDQVGRLSASTYKTNDTNAAGRHAGYAAAGSADLGHTRVSGGHTRQLGQ